MDWQTLANMTAVIVPTVAAAGYIARRVLRSEIKTIVDSGHEANNAVIFEKVRDIVEDDNDELLRKINGTYVRSRMFAEQNQKVEDRFDRIDTRMDQQDELMESSLAKIQRTQSEGHDLLHRGISAITANLARWRGDRPEPPEPPKNKAASA